jgi:hypothetical protein
MPASVLPASFMPASFMPAPVLPFWQARGAADGKPLNFNIQLH